MKNNITLKQKLLNYVLPKHISTVIKEPKHIQYELKKLQLRLNNFSTRLPDNEILENTYQVVLYQYQTYNQLNNVSAKDLTLIPHVLYFEPTILSEDMHFIKLYFREINQRLSTLQKKRVAKGLYFVLLHTYHIEKNNFFELCTQLKLLIANLHIASMQILHAKINKYSILEINACELCVQDALVSSFQNALYERGVSEHEAFAVECYKKWLIFVSKSLSLNEKEQLLDKFIIYSEKNLFCFQQVASNIVIDNLLLPFCKVNKQEQYYKNSIMSFLLKHYNDPRFNDTKWISADINAKNVIKRWLIRSQMESFFAILSETAENMWEQRKIFWLKYYEKNYIEEAWVVFGKEAVWLAKKTLSPRENYATLKGATKNQSALILKINHLVIVEWSHNGSCKFWHENEKAPLFYKHEYSSRELFDSATDRYPHIGNWQYRISRKIYNETGIKL